MAEVIVDVPTDKKTVPEVDDLNGLYQYVGEMIAGNAVDLAYPLESKDAVFRADKVKILLLAAKDLLPVAQEALSGGATSALKFSITDIADVTNLLNSPESAELIKTVLENPVASTKTIKSILTIAQRHPELVSGVQNSDLKQTISLVTALTKKPDLVEALVSDDSIVTGLIEAKKQVELLSSYGITASGKDIDLSSLSLDEVKEISVAAEGLKQLNEGLEQIECGTPGMASQLIKDFSPENTGRKIPSAADLVKINTDILAAKAGVEFIKDIYPGEMNPEVLVAKLQSLKGLKEAVEKKPAVVAMLAANGISLDGTSEATKASAYQLLIKKMLDEPTKVDAFVNNIEVALKTPGLGDVMRNQPSFSTFVKAIAANGNTPLEFRTKLNSMAGGVGGIDNSSLITYLYDNPEKITELSNLVGDDKRLSKLLTEIANGKKDCTDADLLQLTMSRNAAPFIGKLGEALQASGNDKNAGIGGLLKDAASSIDTYQKEHRDALVIASQMVDSFAAGAAMNSPLIAALVEAFKPIIVAYAAKMVKSLQGMFGVNEETLHSVADKMDAGMSPTEIATDATKTLLGTAEEKKEGRAKS